MYTKTSKHAATRFPERKFSPKMFLNDKFWQISSRIYIASSDVSVGQWHGRVGNVLNYTIDNVSTVFPLKFFVTCMYIVNKKATRRFLMQNFPPRKVLKTKTTNLNRVYRSVTRARAASIFFFFYLASPQGQGDHNSVSQLLWAHIT